MTMLQGNSGSQGFFENLFATFCHISPLAGGHLL
jgi:hypothetical protein